MSVTTRVQPIDRDLIIRLVGSPEERSAEFAAFARETLAEAEKTNEAVLGHVPPHKTFVDGAEGASEDQVRPDGVIVYEFELVTDALVWIGDQLELHSPVGSGRDPHPGLYQRSHVLFADGREVPAGADVPQASEYIFITQLPYSRKIEKLDSVYEGVAAIAASRFGNQAKIRFNYTAVIGGQSVNQALTATFRFKSRPNRVATGRFEKTLAPGQHNNADVRWPSIIVNPR